MSLLGNNKKREKNLTKERDKKCEPVAEEIMNMIGLYGLSANNKVDYKKSLELNGPLSASINQLFKDKGFTLSECSYTWSIIQSMLDGVRDFSNKAMQAAFDLAQQKVFNVDEIGDLTLQQIDNVLQSK